MDEAMKAVDRRRSHLWFGLRMTEANCWQLALLAWGPSALRRELGHACLPPPKAAIYGNDAPRPCIPGRVDVNGKILEPASHNYTLTVAPASWPAVNGFLVGDHDTTAITVDDQKSDQTANLIKHGHGTFSKEER